MGLTKHFMDVMIAWTTEKLLRGRGFVREPLLTKITGCESRTVPPLYVPMVDPTMKVSHWETGKTGSPLFASTSQKTYANSLSPLLARYGKCDLSQKNGCVTIFSDAAYLFLWRKIL